VNETFWAIKLFAKNIIPKNKTVFKKWALFKNFIFIFIFRKIIIFGSE
jgi:hypothetical protein